MFDVFEEFARKNDSQEASIEAAPLHGAGSVFRTFVVSAGGSLFFDDKPVASKIAKFCEVISSLHSQGHRFVIVVGGGKVTRNYVAAIKSFGADNFRQDELGIMLTRANALLFVQALDSSFREVLSEPKRALDVLEKGQIPVFGGLFPFFTTDAVGAVISEAIGGTFVNLTNVDGVYSMDPHDNPRAKFFETISYDKLISLVKLAGSKPAQNMVLDLPCCMILKRSNIRGIVLNGDDLENFSAMVRGEQFKGTVIGGTPEELQEQEETGE